MKNNILFFLCSIVALFSCALGSPEDVHDDSDTYEIISFHTCTESNACLFESGNFEYIEIAPDSTFGSAWIYDMLDDPKLLVRGQRMAVTPHSEYLMWPNWPVGINEDFVRNWISVRLDPQRMNSWKLLSEFKAIRSNCIQSCNTIPAQEMSLQYDDVWNEYGGVLIFGNDFSSLNVSYGTFEPQFLVINIFGNGEPLVQRGDTTEQGSLFTDDLENFSWIYVEVNGAALDPPPQPPSGGFVSLVFN